MVIYQNVQKIHLPLRSQNTEIWMLRCTRVYVTSTITHGGLWTSIFYILYTLYSGFIYIDHLSKYGVGLIFSLYSKAHGTTGMKGYIFSVADPSLKHFASQGSLLIFKEVYLHQT